MMTIRGKVVRGCRRLGSGLVHGNCRFCSSASARMTIGLMSCCCGGCLKAPMSTVGRTVIHVHNSCTLTVVFGSCPKRVCITEGSDPVVLKIRGNRSCVTSSIPTVLGCAEGMCCVKGLRVTHVEGKRVAFCGLSNSRVRGRPGAVR